MGDFNDPLKGIINLDVTLYNGNASSIGFQEDVNGDGLYLYEVENGYDYVQVCGRQSCALAGLLTLYVGLAMTVHANGSPSQ